MRWKKARRSDNVVDARGRSGGFRGGRLSLAGVAVVVVIGLLSGQDPLQILGQLANQAGSPTTQQSSAQAGKRLLVRLRHCQQVRVHSGADAPVFSWIG